ncbi:hypothetical protein [Pseudomonas putida]|uniref:hypothetical protein n=1 Tax=Pseudomonas putida TaxID=303 RepID=UPI0039E1A818
MNTLATYSSQQALAAEAAKTAAETARNAAAGSATTAGQQATLATTNGQAQVTLANTARLGAEAAAQQAQTAAAAAGSSAGLPAINGKGGEALTANLDGSGVGFNNAFSRYTLSSLSTAATLDLSKQQVFRVSATTARTLAFANAPGSNRAIVVVVQITGTSAITWPAGIQWAGGSQPVLGATWTRVVLFWDGAGWSGSVGATA